MQSSKSTFQRTFPSCDDDIQVIADNTTASTGSSSQAQHAGKLSPAVGTIQQINRLELFPVKSITTRSPIWTYFDIDPGDSTKSRCKLCPAVITRGSGKSSNTSSMTKHIKGQHLLEYKKLYGPKEHDEDDDYLPAKKTKYSQLDLRSTLERSKKWEFKDPQATKILKAVGEMIAIDCQPYSVVENPGFRRLLNILQPKFMVPGATFVTDKLIPQIRSKVDEHLITLLKNAKFLSFTTDIWTSSTNNYSFISLTGHWIDQFTPHHYVLSMKYFEGHHTGNAIAQILHELLEKWDIPVSKVHLIIRDNGRNMVKGIEDAGFESLSCFLHDLQLVIHDSIKSQRTINDMIKRAKNIATHFNHSSFACGKLSEVQKKLGMETKKIFQDVPTRWNSTYYMLERLYEQRSAIGGISSEIEITNLTSNEWHLAGCFISLLKPFEELTKILSGERCYVSEVIPSILLLKQYLRKEDTAHAGVGTLKSELIDSMDKRFPDAKNCEEVSKKIKNLSIATLLDPRYKLAFFTNDEQRTKFKDILLEELIEYHNPSQSELEQHAGVLSETTAGRSNQLLVPDMDTGAALGSRPLTLQQHTHRSLWDGFDEIVSASQPINSSCQEEILMSKRLAIESELKIYYSLPILSLFAKTSDKKIRNCPLQWWKKNEDKLSNIVPLVQKYLSAPPSSVYSERLFSEAGMIYEENRNRLKPENAENLLFLKHNLPIMNFEYSLEFS